MQCLLAHYLSVLVIPVDMEVDSQLCCRDLLYLDLALDGAVRSSVEASLSLLKAASSSADPETQAGCLLDLVTVCVQSVCLTSGSNVEMVMILRDYQVAHNCPDSCLNGLHVHLLHLSTFASTFTTQGNSDTGSQSTNSVL